VACTATQACARPEYAQKEKKDCAFCHVSQTGGGPRNAHGQYYERNSKSLKGLPLELRPLWKMEAPAETRRVAVGDVLTPKKPSLLLLGASDELTVVDPSAEKPEKLASVKLGPRAGEFVVANLQKGKQAVIALPGAVFVRSGEEFVQKKAPALSSITGVVKFVDGEECVFIFDGMSEPAVYGVNAEASNPLTIGQSMVLPEQGAGVYAWVVARFSPDVTSALGWPPEMAKSPVLGLWDARSDNTLNAWAFWTDSKGAKLVVVDPATIMGGGDIKPVWAGSILGGKVLDATITTDPKGGKLPGILILTASGAEGKGRTLEFLALD